MNNHYDIASYKRICGEFGIDPSSDFTFSSGANSGLGVLYVKPWGESPTKTDYKYPDWNKFSDEGCERKNKTEHMDMTKFYTGDKFGLVIDMCSMVNQEMHGSGTRL